MSFTTSSPGREGACRLSVHAEDRAIILAAHHVHQQIRVAVSMGLPLPFAFNSKVREIEATGWRECMVWPPTIARGCSMRQGEIVQAAQNPLAILLLEGRMKAHVPCRDFTDHLDRLLEYAQMVLQCGEKTMMMLLLQGMM